MNDEYKELRERADKLFHHFNDVCDDRVKASEIAKDVRGVVEEFEMNKNPHSIEDLVKHLAEAFKELRGHSEVIDPRHADELYDGYEDLRQDIRKLSNY